MEGSRSRKEITSARHAPCLAFWLRRYESMGHLSLVVITSSATPRSARPTCGQGIEMILHCFIGSLMMLERPNGDGSHGLGSCTCASGQC
jgi:hypothetical protein